MCEIDGSRTVPWIDVAYSTATYTGIDIRSASTSTRAAISVAPVADLIS
jgi:hypothetical protein